MATVNMHHAKTNLSKLVASLTTGAEDEVVIALNGAPQVRMTAIARTKQPRKFGLAKDKFTFDYEAFQALDAEVQQLFEDSADPFGEKIAS